MFEKMAFLVIALGCVAFLGQPVSAMNISVYTLTVLTTDSSDLCTDSDTLDKVYNELKDTAQLEYIPHTCIVIGNGLKSQIGIKTNDTANVDNLPYSGTGFTAALQDDGIECVVSLTWDGEQGVCGCELNGLNIDYTGYSSLDIVLVGEVIEMQCIGSERVFPDFTQLKNFTCLAVSDTTKALDCELKSKLKEFSNNVAHFAGTLESYILVKEPFKDELKELALCFWLKTHDAVGSVFSLANEDHWNALRFDTHTSHIHFTLGGLHTDHGLVPPIALQDDIWRYFCCSWDSISGNATVYVRSHGSDTKTYHSNLPLSVGPTVYAKGGQLALGNLWKEYGFNGFNPIGSLDGDVMDLTLYKTRVNISTYDLMFRNCSTILDRDSVVLGWAELMKAKNSTVSGTFGQKVCYNTEYVYGGEKVNFPMSNPKWFMSDFVSNYAKIDNAFSAALTELTICATIKSSVKIGTIFSYVVSDPEFSEQIVLEKHKTHMHFYMAGIDQQVGAVPKIQINNTRWFCVCYTWQNDGTWRGYLDGVEKTNNDTGKLVHSAGKVIQGKGTVYLGIMKKMSSFRRYRGYAGDATEVNLWGKALSSEQIHKMVTRNEVYEEHLLVSWATLLDHLHGDIVKSTVAVCPPPAATLGNVSGVVERVTGSGSLFLVNQKVKYSCPSSVLRKEDLAGSVKTCLSDGTWSPAGVVICQSCKEADMFTCAEKCIAKAQQCDGNKDCQGGEDETDCPAKGMYWVAIGILMALLVLIVPSVMLVRKMKAKHTEMLRVKKLTDDWEIKRAHLQLEEKLGEGAFGQVYKGMLLMKPNYEEVSTVAVKELSDIATERDKNMFLEEIRLSKKLGNHPNIVGIVGAIIVYEPYCLVLEFVDGGDLLEFLQKSRKDGAELVSTTDQIFFAWQIANGMEYVGNKNFVHRDLAARNVLISTNKQVKVTDFGLARDLYNYDEYQSEGGRLPLKWMSPEAIFQLKFTTESDVWSYGVLMYELFSWGGSPYPGIEPAELRDRLVNGYRMNAPEGTPDYIYSMMLQCWEFKPDNRPKFSSLRTFIESYISDYPLFIKLQEKIQGELSHQSVDCESSTPLVAGLVVPMGQAGAVSREPKEAVAKYCVGAENVAVEVHNQVNMASVDNSTGIVQLTRGNYMNT